MSSVRKTKNWNNRIEAFALADRAERLQLTDEGQLREVEECLRRALKLDCKSVEVLQELAHLYDAVIPDAKKAKKYALKCRESAMKVVREMDAILADD
ncbi:MAG: hypothetical protein ACRD3E_05540 [Terriglobales bacterium]